MTWTFGASTIVFVPKPGGSTILFPVYFAAKVGGSKFLFALCFHCRHDGRALGSRLDFFARAVYPAHSVAAPQIELAPLSLEDIFSDSAADSQDWNTELCRSTVLWEAGLGLCCLLFVTEWLKQTLDQLTKFSSWHEDQLASPFGTVFWILVFRCCNVRTNTGRSFAQSVTKWTWSFWTQRVWQMHIVFTAATFYHVRHRLPRWHKWGWHIIPQWSQAVHWKYVHCDHQVELIRYAGAHFDEVSLRFVVYGAVTEYFFTARFCNIRRNVRFVDQQFAMLVLYFLFHEGQIANVRLFEHFVCKVRVFSFPLIGLNEAYCKYLAKCPSDPLFRQTKAFSLFENCSFHVRVRCSNVHKEWTCASISYSKLGGE